jgi:hypothetical protein
MRAEAARPEGEANEGWRFQVITLSPRRYEIHEVAESNFEEIVAKESPFR